MHVEFDPSKDRENVRKRGLSFSMVEAFDWSLAMVFADVRQDYGEPRFVAVGFIDHLVYVVVFTPRGENTRVISFRRANNREIKAYEKARSI